MSNADGLLRSRFDRSPGTAALALGDLLVLSGFLTVGAVNHGVDPVTMPARVAEIIAPFLVGWVVAAPVVGAYAPGVTRTIRTSVLRGTGAWLGAAVIGFPLRASPYFSGNSPLSFVLVVTGIGLVSFAVWRATVAALR